MIIQNNPPESIARTMTCAGQGWGRVLSWNTELTRLSLKTKAGSYQGALRNQSYTLQLSQVLGDVGFCGQPWGSNLGLKKKIIEL